MKKAELYMNLLSKYCKQIVHIRQQYHNPSSNLGIVLGSGASKGIGLPMWKELVTRISQSNQIKDIDVSIDPNGDAISNAQLLYQAYKAKMLSNCKDEDYTYNRIDMVIRAQWQRIVHEALYKDVDPNIAKTVPKDHYLWPLIKIVKHTPMTINYNFDDTIQRLLSATRTDEEMNQSRGYKTLWNSNVYMFPKNSVVYHPNGFLPYRINEHPSERLVFLEDSFADQLIESIQGHYNVLCDYFTHNTCLMIGLSLEDPTLKHILRTNAVNHPGVYHYYIHYTDSREKLKNENVISDANFEVYNLITLFLNSAEIAGLLELIEMNEETFDKFVEEVGGLYKSYKYILVGSVAVGKSTAMSYFRSVATQDEWLEPMPEDMAKDPSAVENDRINSIDQWIAEQWGKKNYKMLRIKDGIHLIDRGPLDAFAFTPAGEWKKKALLTKEKISPCRSTRSLCPAEIIFLKGDPATMASRAILSQKETDKNKLYLQQELIEYVYSQASKGVMRIDTRNKSKAQVAKEVARIIFMESYDEAPLNDVLERIANGDIDRPNIKQLEAVEK